MFLQGLASAAWAPESVHTVVLVGRATLLPPFRALVTALLPSATVYDELEPDFATEGAALLGWRQHRCEGAVDKEERRQGRRVLRTHVGEEGAEGPQSLTGAEDALCALLHGQWSSPGSSLNE